MFKKYESRGRRGSGGGDGWQRVAYCLPCSSSGQHVEHVSAHIRYLKARIMLVLVLILYIRVRCVYLIVNKRPPQGVLVLYCRWRGGGPVGNGWRTPCPGHSEDIMSSM